MCRQFIHDLAVFLQQLLGLLVAVTQHLHYFRIDIRRRHIGTGQGCPAVQILAFHRRQPHQAEFLTHTEAGDHVAGNARGLLDIVGSSRGDGIEDDLLRRTASQQSHQTFPQLRFRVQIFLFLRYVHDIPQRSHGSWHDGDLLYRFRIFLQRAYQRMAHLMIGNDLALFLTHDTVLFLFAHKYLLHRVEQILLIDVLSACLDSIDSRLIDHVSQIGSHRAGGCQRDLIQIHGLIHTHILGMYFQDFHTAF